MTNHTLRGLGTGIILSTGLLATVYFTQTPDQKEAELNDNTVNTYLHSKNMTAISTAELQSLKERTTTATATAPAASTAAPKPSKAEPKKEEPAEKVYRATVKVSQGMSTGEVCDFLEEKKIIKDSKGFLKYLRSKNLEGEVRAGTYKVNSKMDFKKLAGAIT